MSRTGLDINVLKRRIAELEAEVKELQKIHDDDQNNLNETMQEFEKFEAENAKLTTQLGNAMKFYCESLEVNRFLSKRAESAEVKIKELEDESEYLSLQKLINWKAKEDAEAHLAEAEKLPEKWRKQTEEYKKSTLGNVARIAVCMCAEELKFVLRGGEEKKEAEDQ